MHGGHLVGTGLSEWTEGDLDMPDQPKLQGREGQGGTRADTCSIEGYPQCPLLAKGREPRDGLSVYLDGRKDRRTASLSLSVSLSLPTAPGEREISARATTSTTRRLTDLMDGPRDGPKGTRTDGRRKSFIQRDILTILIAANPRGLWQGEAGEAHG